MADGNVTIEINANIANFTNSLQDAEKETSAFSEKVKRSLSNAFDIGKFIDGFIKEAQSALGDALKYAVQTGMEYNAQMEQYQSSFTTMLGNQEAALKHIEELKAMAAATPFEMSDLAGASELLLSFGSSVEDVMPELEMLGDISLGNSDKLNGLALVFAQVKSQGKLMAQDLNQMINQGFNPLQIISEQTGKSMAELRDEMADGAVTFDMLKVAMESATSEGGRFYNAMENASTTTHGLVATLKDNVSEKLGEVFGGLSEVLRTDILPALIDIVNSIDAEAIADGIKGIINVVQTLLPLINVLIAYFGTLAAIKIFDKIADDFETAKTSFTSLITLVQVVSAQFSTAALQVSLYTAQLGVTKIVNAAALSELSLLQIAVGVLTGKISLATAATYAFNAAMKFLSSPTGVALVISLIVGAITAISHFTKTTSESTKQLQAAREEVERICTAYDENCDNIEDETKATEDNISALRGQIDAMLKLNDEILSNADSVNNLEAAKIRLSDIVTELNSKYPNLQLSIDGTTGALINESDAVRQLSENYFTLLKNQALYNEYTAKLEEAYIKKDSLIKQAEDTPDYITRTATVYELAAKRGYAPGTPQEFMFVVTHGRAWDGYAWSGEKITVRNPDKLAINAEIKETEADIETYEQYIADLYSNGFSVNQNDSNDAEANDTATTNSRKALLDQISILKDRQRYGDNVSDADIAEAYQTFLNSFAAPPQYGEEDYENYVKAREWVYDYENDLADKAEQEEQERAERAREQRESAAQAAKQAREQELDDIEYYHDMGILSDKEYRDRLAEYRDRYFDESSEDYRTLTLKIRDLDKSIAKETLDSFTTLYESGEMSGEQYIAAMSAGLSEFGEELGDEIDGYTALIEAANTKLVDDAFAAQKAILDNTLESSDKSVKDYLEYYDELALLRDEYYAEGSEEHAKYTQIIDDGLKSTFELAKSEYSAALGDIESQFNEEFDAIGAKRDEFARKFDLNGDDYFTTTSHTFTGLYKPNEDGTAFVREEQVITRTRLADITGKTERLKRYSELMKRIKARGNIPPQLLNELFSADVETGILQMETLLNMPQSDFDAAMEQYAEYFNAQSEIADEYVADEISDLRERITDELGEMVPEKFFELGEDSAAKFGEAFLPALNEILGNIWLNISGALGIPLAATATGSAATTTTSFTNNYYLVPTEGESTQSQIETCRRQSVITEVMTA